MAVQPRPTWFFPMARQAAPVPIPTARPTTPSAPAPRPSIVGPAFPSQPQEPNPPPPPADASPTSTDAPPPSSPATATAPLRSPVAPTAAPPRSPVAPAKPTPKSPVALPAPAPSTPRSPIAPPPLVNISPSASKSPTIKASNSLPTSPAPKVSPTTNVLSPSIPSSPKTQTLGPSSVLTSPVPKPIATATHNGLVPGQAATPASSPKIFEPLKTTPVQSPETKVASRPPSPLTLSPSQINTESAHETMIPSEVKQKLVLVQETIGDPMVMLNNHDDGIASSEKPELKKDRSANKKLFDSGEYRMSVIILAGANKGAIMELSPIPKNHYSAGNPDSLYKTISIKGGTDGEQSSIDRSELRRYKDKLNKVKATQSTPTTAIMNSNFQGVNNAILYDCTFTHQDPSIHLSLTGNGTSGNGIHLTDHQS